MDTDNAVPPDASHFTADVCIVGAGPGGCAAALQLARHGVATVLVDERYSSAVISHQRGDLIDDQAAAIILQQYFDDHSKSKS